MSFSFLYSHHMFENCLPLVEYSVYLLSLSVNEILTKDLVKYHKFVKTCENYWQLSFKVSVIIRFVYMIKSSNFTFSFFFFFIVFLNILTECHETKKIHQKVNTFEGLFSTCSYYITIKMFIIWCTWFITIIFRFNFCWRIVSKFFFSFFIGFINRCRISSRITRNIPFW